MSPSTGRLRRHRDASADCTVYTSPIDHQFVARTMQILQSRSPGLTVECRISRRWEPARGGGCRLVHLHWIDVLLRRGSVFHSIRGIARLVGFVSVLRLRGVPVVWTVHNPIGKSHARRRLDRMARGLLGVLCSQFIVLNRGAAGMAAAEMPRWARRRFAGRVHHVPMPNDMRDHGRVLSLTEARAILGLEATVPIVAYLPGAGQVDRANDLRDPAGRFGLLSRSLDRSDDLHVQEVPGGWEVRGRPTDDEYGALICAADAVVLADDVAFGSMTLHAAVELCRPVISPACPAVEELAELGGAVAVTGPLTPDAIVAALRSIDPERAARAFDEFRARHDDDLVAESLAAVYRAAGLDLHIASRSSTSLG